jgi:hypothetical protein
MKFQQIQTKMKYNGEKQYMKRTLWTAVLVTMVALLAIGCSNPMKDAQTMLAAGKYEELVAKYSANPELAAVVQQAKDKIAEKLFGEGKYAEVLAMYGTSPIAAQAKAKMAEMAFMAGNYMEVMTKYADTPWAAMAKAKMDSISNAAAGGKPGQPGQPGKPGETPKGGVSAALEKEAQGALNTIMAIKIPNMRKNALGEFVKNSKWAGTEALKKAQTELNK